jgi:hypothetical protein
MESSIKESPIMSYSANPEPSIIDSCIKKSSTVYSCKQEELFISAFTHVNGGSESDRKECGIFLPIFSPFW